MTNERICKLAEKIFWNGSSGYSCSQTVLMVMMEYIDEKDELWQKISAPFGGGLCNTHRSVCGAVSGALMFIGIKENGDKTAAGNELLEYVSKKYGSIYCDKILDIDFDDEEQVRNEKDAKGQSICLPMIKDICSWLVDKYC